MADFQILATTHESSNENETGAFGATIISEMQQIVTQIPDSISLYRQELEKLLTACIKSQESEQRLMHRTKEILGEIHTSHEAMLRDQEEENEVIIAKKKSKLELETVQQQVLVSNQMESEKQQKLNDLRSSLVFLQEEVSKLSMPGTMNANGQMTPITLNEEQQQRVDILKRQRAELVREVETKQNSFQDLRMETSSLSQILQEEETKNINLEEKKAHLATTHLENQKQTEKEIRRKNQLEKELKNLKQTFEMLQRQVIEKEKLQQFNEENLRDKELRLRESKQLMEKYLKQYDTLFRTTHQLTEAMQAQWQKNVELEKENLQVEEKIQQKEQNIVRTQKEVQKTVKLIELTQEQLVLIEEKRIECDVEKDQLKTQVHDVLNGTIEMEKKQSDLLKKKLDEMVREREVLNKMLVKASDRTQTIFDFIKIKENTLKNLQNEINGFEIQVKNQRQEIQQLVIERDWYEKDATKANQKYLTFLEEAKLQEIQVNSLQQKIHESETRLKQQQNLYEAVRADRNVYSKNLMESQEEIAQMKRQFKMMTHQIEQLKEEITSKDHALVKEHFDHHKVDKEKETLKNDLQRLKKQISSSEQILTNQEMEIFKLSKIIQEAEDEKQRQVKEFASVSHDCETLRQQLLQRQQELNVLYEKLKIQKSTLEKGAFQFEEKQKEMVDIQNKIHHLLFEQETSLGQLNHTDNLKNELMQLEKELTEEKIKIRALSEELDHPMNVHRWRLLEGSDPKRYEMIKKIQVMQKKLIEKYEKATEKDLLILEKEKLYVELKNILARQPGAEVEEQLVVYKETLKDKQNQMKNMEKELEMYRLQVKEYQNDHLQIQKEMNKLQKKWVQEKMDLQNSNQFQ